MEKAHNPAAAASSPLRHSFVFTCNDWRQRLAKIKTRRTEENAQGLADCRRLNTVITVLYRISGVHGAFHLWPCKVYAHLVLTGFRQGRPLMVSWIFFFPRAAEAMHRMPRGWFPGFDGANQMSFDRLSLPLHLSWFLLRLKQQLCATFCRERCSHRRNPPPPKKKTKQKMNWHLVFLF